MASDLLSVIIEYIMVALNEVKNVLMNFILVPRNFWHGLPEFVQIIIKFFFVLILFVIAYAWYKNKDEWKKVVRT